MRGFLAPTNDPITRPVRVAALTTPVRRNSASPFTSTVTTRSELDPRIADELKGRAWTTEQIPEVLFDHFFPETWTQVPIAPRFPSQPDEAAVVAWFQDYGRVVAMCLQKNPLGSWKASSNRALLHPDTMKRKVDLFLYQNKQEAETPVSDDYDWSKVLVVAEFKFQKKLSDLDPTLRVQLASYCREVFFTQPGRSFVHAFSVVNSTMRCWFYTRSGGICSAQINLGTSEGHQTFRQVFCGLMNFDATRIGLMSPDQSTQCGGYTIEIEAEAFFKTAVIASRGTTCWRLRSAVRVAELSNPFTEPPAAGTISPEWVLKSYWRYEG